MEFKHWIVAGSILVFLVSLVALPAILIVMPADYFTREAQPAQRARHPLVRFLVLAVKNFLGLLLFSAGFMMLFTPGQGILAMVAGLWLMDVPGKRSLERRIVARPGVLAAINRLRTACGRPHLKKPPLREVK
jgi:hypothetical protein